MNISGNILNQAERRFLLNLARKVIDCQANNISIPQESYFSDILKKKYGVFVTLHKHGDLRGCIGYVEGFKPLQDAVMDMATSAAFKDPRFSPVKPKEVKEIDIEISVLSPLHEVDDVSEIEVGKHGLIIEQDFYKGLLLPQVATENKWDRETFLKNTCIKAGLPSNAWKEKNTKIYIFSAEIFSEIDFLSDGKEK